MSNKISLTSIVVFFTFVPFIKIPILTLETSAWAGIFAILLFIRYPNLLKSKYRINLLFFIGVSLTLYDWSHIGDIQYNIFYIKTVLSLLFGLMVFFVTIMYFHRINFRLVLGIIALWLLIGLLQITTFENEVNHILEIILTRSNSGGLDSYRGISLLANESSYAAIYLVSFMILIDLMLIKGAINQNLSLAIKALLIITILLTKSVNGVLLLATYFMLNVFFSENYIKRSFTGLFLFLLLFYILLEIGNELNLRSVEIFLMALNSPDLLFNDESIFSRFSFIYIAYYGFFDNYFLPNGVGSYSYNWMELATKLDMLGSYEVSRSFGKYMMPMSFIGGVAHDYGFIGLIFIFLLIFYPLLKNTDTAYNNYIRVSSFFVFFLWLQTCSYALPLPWFLLGVNHALVATLYIKK